MWRILVGAVLVCWPGCQGAGSAPCPASPPVRPLPAPGAQGPVILYPRHRITSAAPPIILLVPGESGPVEVELGTRQDLRRRTVTSERVLSWPAAVRLLRPEEAGWVILRSGGRTARSGFVLAPWRRPEVAGRNAISGVPLLLGRGLPMEAFRLVALDPPGATHLAEVAAIRAGLSTSPVWRRQ